MKGKRVLFADILKESKDGEWGKGKFDFGLLKSLVIRGTDFSSINDPNKTFPVRYIRKDIVERKRLYYHDILLETAGGTAKQSTGRSTILRKSFFHYHKDIPILCSSFARYLRINNKKYNPLYIYYLLHALYENGYMSIYNLQHTGVSRFQYTTFKNKTFLLIPPFPTQKKIAAILSTYDDLIENNNHRIAILEKMAEEIYREWFVRMRFPGHEKVKMVKGLPEGWEVKKLEDVPINIIDGDRGKNYPKKEEFSNEGFCLFLNTGNIKNDTFVFLDCDFITERKDSLLRQGKVKIGDIILTTRGTVGNIAYFSEYSYFKNVRINSGMLIIRSKNNSDSIYYYFLFKSPLLKKQYKLYSSGAAQPQLPIKDLNKINILCPTKIIIKAFVDNIACYYKKIEYLRLCNLTLQKTRDLLLPRLISGKLDVENLDITFPPGMEDTDA